MNGLVDRAVGGRVTVRYRLWVVMGFASDGLRALYAWAPRVVGMGSARVLAWSRAPSSRSRDCGDGWRRRVKGAARAPHGLRPPLTRHHQPHGRFRSGRWRGVNKRGMARGSSASRGVAGGVPGAWEPAPVSAGGFRSANPVRRAGSVQRILIGGRSPSVPDPPLSSPRPCLDPWCRWALRLRRSRMSRSGSVRGVPGLACRSSGCSGGRCLRCCCPSYCCSCLVDRIPGGVAVFACLGRVSQRADELGRGDVLLRCGRSAYVAGRGL